jgi:siroheme synthase (precorrin-2 oxidase/ferrochelatase)
MWLNAKRNHCTIKRKFWIKGKIRRKWIKRISTKETINNKKKYNDGRWERVLARVNYLISKKYNERL